MKIASTDHGSVLASDASALVAEADGSLSLMLANYQDDEPVPRMAQLLAAVALRADDEEWVDEVLAIFDEKPNS